MAGESRYEFADFDDNKVWFYEHVFSFDDNGEIVHTYLECQTCGWQTPDGKQIVDVLINDHVNLAEKHACDEHLTRRPLYEHMLKECAGALSGA